MEKCESDRAKQEIKQNYFRNLTTNEALCENRILAHILHEYTMSC